MTELERRRLVEDLDREITRVDRLIDETDRAIRVADVALVVLFLGWVVSIAVVVWRGLT